MTNELNAFYLNKEEPNQSCLLALRNIILKEDVNITETTKYGMPCFCYKTDIFCYLWVDKKTDAPYILMANGKYLNHPELEIGKRAKMKIYKVKANTDLPVATIRTILQQGIDLYKSGKIKT